MRLATGILLLTASPWCWRANLSSKAVFDDIWNQWIGDDPQCWPQRSCIGVEFRGSPLIEITAVALRQRERQ